MTEHRRTYSHDDNLLTEVVDLLTIVFPFFREQEEAARELGLRWEVCSTPFVYRHDDRIVSHVGVVEVPLVMDGERLVVGSVHAVATHPDFRRRGFYRSIMNELLDWCDRKYETLHLTTDNPEFFEPFGFRTVAECHFETHARPSSDAPKARPLEDARVLRRLLDAREPVSHVLGACDRDVFLFNEARHALHYAEDLDAVFSYDIEDGTLKLWDIVATTLPTFAQVLARLDGEFEHIEVHFSPDRLGVDCEAVFDPDDEDVLMARGPYPPEGRPVKLPMTTRC